MGDTTELIREVLSTQMPLYAARKISVEQHLPTDLPLLEVDPNRLKEVVLNLCKNALEAMPDGGTLTMALDEIGAVVRLSITDTGPGIPEEINIFEPFVTTKDKGSGLGLAIAHQIVSAHGGTLTCSSTPGQGKSFVVILPRAGAPPTAPDQ